MLRSLGGPDALADLNKKDGRGRTPMDVARARGDALTVAVLEQVALDDAQLHRMRRERKELARMRAALRQKEIVFGRPLETCEGGAEFATTPGLQLDRAAEARLAGGLRAAANVPRVTGVAVERVVLGLHKQEAARAAGRAAAAARAASRPPPELANPRARCSRARQEAGWDDRIP